MNTTTINVSWEGFGNDEKPVIHFVYPSQHAPKNRTQSYTSDLNGPLDVLPFVGPFFCVVQCYDTSYRLVGKEIQPLTLFGSSNTFKKGIHRIEFSGSKAVKLHFSNDHHVSDPVNPYVMLSECEAMLKCYIEKEIGYIQATKPSSQKIRDLHSVFYKIPTKPVIYNTYSSLVLRGNDILQGVTKDDLLNWQNILAKKITKAMHDIGERPSTFVNNTMKLKNSGIDFHVAHHIYDTLVKTLSHMISSTIKYKEDISATVFRDYIGLNKNYVTNTIYGDCEDIAQFGFDIINVIKSVFPSSINTLLPQHTLMYHISAILSACKIYMCQGAVGHFRDSQYQSHVWLMLLPVNMPAFFVEGTGMPNLSMYRYVTHVWGKEGNVVKNYFLINPENNSYGLPVPLITKLESHSATILNEWMKEISISTNITSYLKFATLLSQPLFQPLEILTS